MNDTPESQTEAFLREYEIATGGQSLANLLLRKKEVGDAQSNDEGQATVRAFVMAKEILTDGGAVHADLAELLAAAEHDPFDATTDGRNRIAAARLEFIGALAEKLQPRKDNPLTQQAERQS